MRRSWQFVDGLALALLTGLALVATASIWGDIFALAARDDESSYILIAPGVALWLAWCRRDRIRYCLPRPSPLGCLAIVGGWGLMFLGHERAIDLFRDVGALLTVAGAVYVAVGRDIFIRFAAAWGALLFLIPVPGRLRHVIAVPLQQASAGVTQFILDVTGFAVERHGNMLVVNGVEVAIAEACNGMRMVAAMALIAYAFVFSFPMKWWGRLVLLGISPLVAILVNVIRLYPTTILYGHSTAEIADAFHDLAGWGVLFLAMGMMWSVLALLRYLEVPIARYNVREEV
ncbi:MAG: exosortase/archaeosortase family protein [Planctomycetota bacterium]|nr:exosortase/archaeosortase family protein [Planctomycetota bacterium]